jgi:hypothetical protein
MGGWGWDLGGGVWRIGRGGGTWVGKGLGLG